MKTIAQQLNIKDFPFIITDKDGNQTYSENSNGFWSKREYDSNSNQTYHENSTGYWHKREFDKNGKETYLEISTSGVIIDKRPKVTLTLQEIAEKLGVAVESLRIKE